jgi:hypothetical protein
LLGASGGGGEFRADSSVESCVVIEMLPAIRRWHERANTRPGWVELRSGLSMIEPGQMVTLEIAQG